MQIRKAMMEDINKIMTIYAHAREFMCENGNANQWINGYPSQELVENTIRQQKCYVCEMEDKIVGTFYFAREEDPAYRVIEEGNWLNDEPYAVVHRVAVAEGTKGVGSFCLEWALRQADNIRIDTHKDNRPMQGLLRKLGFTYCGRVYVENGTPRIAFQKTGKADDARTEKV